MVAARILQPRRCRNWRARRSVPATDEISSREACSIGEEMQFPRWLTARAKIRKNVVRAIGLDVFAMLVGMNGWFARPTVRLTPVGRTRSTGAYRHPRSFDTTALVLARFVEGGFDCRDERTAFCREVVLGHARAARGESKPRNVPRAKAYRERRHSDRRRTSHSRPPTKTHELGRAPL
jgi:hypothetical protein